MSATAGEPGNTTRQTEPEMPLQKLRDLFLFTLEIHRRTLSRPGPRLPNIEGTYDVRYAVEMARRLPLEEITSLGHATDLREEGLTAARSGDLDLGADLVAEAKRHYESAGLSPEALLLAGWFQWPADAYIQYRRGDHLDAEASLLRGIEACVALRNEFKYRVELRRIHLARNIVRVRNHGGRPLDALELAHHLMNYIEGAADSWPWMTTAITNTDSLELDIRLLLTDQVLADVARLLSPTRPDARELLRVADDRRWFHAGENPEPIERARVWLSARSMAVKGQWDAFLRHAGVFFAESPGRLGRAWFELTTDLINIGTILAPNEVVDRSVD